jgi:membrane protease YdiL (CAAX protease family)
VTVQPGGPRALARRYPVPTFVALALVLTWVVWVPRAFGARWAADVGTLWSYGPAFAALAAAGLDGRVAVRRWWSRVVRWRVGVRWYLLALLGPAAFWAAVAWASERVDAATGPPRALDLGAAALAVFAVLLLTDGVGEEAGWRGFLLPHWLTRAHPLVASLGVGLVWAVWHLPLVYTPGSALFGSPVAFHLIDLPATAVLYTWLVTRAHGSALLAAVLHASISIWTPLAVPTGTPAQLAVVLAAKLLLVAAAVGTGLVPRRGPDDA